MFPAWAYQENNFNVLHLAGEHDIYRKLVFENGFTTLCRHHQQNRDDNNNDDDDDDDDEKLSNQIGLSRKKLIQIRYNLTHNIINCILFHILKFKNSSRTIFSSQNKFNGSACEVLRSSNVTEEVFIITASFISEYIQIAIQHGYADKNRLYHNSYQELQSEFQSIMYIFNYIYQVSSKHLETTLQSFYRNVQQQPQSDTHTGKINNLFIGEVQDNLNIMLSYLKDIKNTIEFYTSFERSQKYSIQIIRRYTLLAFEILNNKLEPVLLIYIYIYINHSIN